MATATGRVYKRGKKIYMTINKGYIDGERIRESRATTAKTLREAKQILETELFKLNRAAATGEAQDNNYSLEDLFIDWTHYIETTVPNPKTAHEYIRNARLALDTLNKACVFNVNELLPKTITELQQNILNMDLSSNIANKAVTKLKALLDYGVDNKLIITNPISKASLLPTTRKKYRRAYTEAEVFKLLELTPPAWRGFFHFAVSTGCRLAEIQNLRWQDIDINNSQINIVPRLDWKPKSKTGERAIPMTEKLKETLSTLEKSSEYVFVTKDGKKRENNALTVLKRILKKALPVVHPDWDKRKLEKELQLLDFHALRYTFCTELIKNGVDIKTVQKIMGHADITTTLGIYAQYCHGGMEDAITKIKW